MQTRQCLTIWIYSELKNATTCWFARTLDFCSSISTFTQVLSYAIYDHIPTNIAPAACRGPPDSSHLTEASHPSVTWWHRWAARWPSRGLPSLSLLFHPLTFCATRLSASLVLASNSHTGSSTCLLEKHRVGFQPRATGWLVYAGLLCAEPRQFNSIQAHLF